MRIQRLASAKPTNCLDCVLLIGFLIASVTATAVAEQVTLRVYDRDRLRDDRAKVEIDGRDLGKSHPRGTVFRVNLEPGVHTLRIRHIDGTRDSIDVDWDDLEFEITCDVGTFAFAISSDHLRIEPSSGKVPLLRRRPGEIATCDRINRYPSSWSTQIRMERINASPEVRNSRAEIGENSPVGTPVGTVSASDPNHDALIYTIVAGDGAAAFAVDRRTGHITVRDSALLDYETRTTLELIVRAKDPGGLSDTGRVTIALIDRNERPAMSPLKDRAVKEGHWLRLTLSARDVDQGDKLSFSAEDLPPGARLERDSGEFAWLPDHTQSGRYKSIRFVVCDNGTPRLCDSQEMSITVRDTIRPRSEHHTDPPSGRRGWFNSQVRFTITASDDEGRGKTTFIHYIVDGGRHVTVKTGSITLALTGDGAHVIEYWAVDDAGNVEMPINVARIRIDTTIPDIEEVRCYTDSSRDRRIEHGAWTNRGELFCEWQDPGSPSGDTYYYELNHSWGNTIGFQSERTTTDNHVIVSLPGEGDGWWLHIGVVNGAGTQGPQGRPRKIQLKYDRTPPRMHCSEFDNAWHAENVVVSCEARDSLSGLANIEKAHFLLKTHVPDGTETETALTDRVLIHDVAGNFTSAGPLGPLRIDQKAPAVSIASYRGERGENGWFTSAVTVTFRAHDGGAGLADPEQASFARTTGSEGASVAVPSGPIHDAVGNVGTATATLNIDKSPPLATIISGPPESAIINRRTATVEFEGQDQVSGIARFECDVDHTGFKTCESPLTLEGLPDGMHDVRVHAIDRAGNRAPPARRTWGVDLTPPAIDGRASPAPNAYGWHNTDVTVHFNCIDPMRGGVRSGIDQAPNAVTLTREGQGQSATATCTDNAGNSARTAVRGIHIDKTRCSLSFEFVDRDGEAALRDQDDFLLHEAIVAQWSALDPISGIASAIATGPDGEMIDTDTIGKKAFRIVAWDRAGNTCLLRRVYRVSAEVVYIQPVMKTYKVGATVEIAFRMHDARGDEVAHARPTLTLRKAGSNGEMEREHPSSPSIWSFHYRPDDRMYVLELDTAELEPGAYEFLIQYGRGYVDRFRTTLKTEL